MSDMTTTTRGTTATGEPLTPGVNVDRIDIAAGLRGAHECGYTTAQDDMVVTYALQRWARGEESGAFATLTSGGVDLTSSYRIIATARASAEAAHTAATGPAPEPEPAEAAVTSTTTTATLTGAPDLPDSGGRAFRPTHLTITVTGSAIHVEVRASAVGASPARTRLYGAGSGVPIPAWLHAPLTSLGLTPEDL